MNEVNVSCAACGRELESGVPCSSDDCPANPAGWEVKVERIGNVELGVGMVDGYVLLRRLDDELTVEQAEEWLLPRVYRDGGLAGGYYCTAVTCFQKNEAEVVAIIHHRWDV